MRVAVLKLSGVESVDVSLEKASADIRLKPDNRITLAELRDLIRKNGYPTKDAQIVARGKVVERNGQLALDLLNGSSMRIASDPKHPDTFTQLDAIREDGRGTIVEVTGVARSLGKGEEQVTVDRLSFPR